MDKIFIAFLTVVFLGAMIIATLYVRDMFYSFSWHLMRERELLKELKIVLDKRVREIDDLGYFSENGGIDLVNKENEPNDNR